MPPDSSGVQASLHNPTVARQILWHSYTGCCRVSCSFGFQFFLKLFFYSSVLCSAHSSFHSVFLSFFPKFLSCCYRVQILCKVLETQRCMRVLGLWECSLHFCGMIPHAKFMESFCSGFDKTLLERNYSSS